MSCLLLSGAAGVTTISSSLRRCGAAHGPHSSSSSRAPGKCLSSAGPLYKTLGSTEILVVKLAPDFFNNHFSKTSLDCAKVPLHSHADPSDADVAPAFSIHCLILLLRLQKSSQELMASLPGSGGFLLSEVCPAGISICLLKPPRPAKGTLDFQVS